MAELRSYNPTWRDRLARGLLDFGAPKDLTVGLLGSAGLGPQSRSPLGGGLLDLTPAGLPFWLQEAEMAKQSGGLGSGMLDTIAAVPIPGAKAVGQMAKKAGDVAEGIRVYHGSPHDFDKFDMSKIGTGEGAQAYGHGLYFAETPEVAKSYRMAGEARYNRVTGGSMTPKQEFAHDLAEGGASEVQILEQLARKYSNDVDFDEANRLAQEAVRNRGRMYEARLNASPDEFLDWDKPFREQSKNVQLALRQVLGRPQAKTQNYPDFKLHQIYAPGANSEKVNPIASVREESGKFIRYMAGSDAPPKTFDTLGQAMDSAVAEYGDTPMALFVKSPNEVKKLNKAGIKGIRYKDQGSRGDEGGTSNYVVFDDNIIEILKKYGIAGLSMLGGGAGLLAGSGGQAEAAPAGLLGGGGGY